MSLETYFHQFLDDYQGLSDYQIEGTNLREWNYEDGCLYLGLQRLYEATGDKAYKDYIIKHVSPYVEGDGVINTYRLKEYSLDFINAGRAFYFLYDQTGEVRYRKAIDSLMRQLEYQPCLTTGNYWHKLIYPFQVWLDGLYMAQPFCMEYENRFNGRKRYFEILHQFDEVRRILYDEKMGLYYHAYDEYKERTWADPETGLSPNFWLRSIGWFLMALTDCYELASEEIYEVKARYGELLREAVHGILPYQDKESRMFYQLPALPNHEGNYTETSGNLMVAYALLKGSRIGALLKEKYIKKGKEIYESVIKEKLIEKEDAKWHLVDTCASAGLGPHKERDGSIEYYLSEKRADDDPKAVGMLMMTTAEVIRIEGGGKHG